MQQMWPPRRQRILVADVPGAMATLRAALGNIAELVRADTLDEALREMARGVDVVLCGLQFDGGRMFEFLPRAAAMPGETPILCLRDVDSPLPQDEMDRLRERCVALGAARFFDIHTLRSTLGTVEGYRELRLAVLACLDEAEARRLLAAGGENRHAGAGG